MSSNNIINQNNNQVICKVINSNGMNRPSKSQVNGIAVVNFTHLYKKVFK